MAKPPEQEYDVFNVPIPGESLTTEPKAWPWDNPPLYPSFEDALDKTMEKMFERKAASRITTMLDAGVPIEAIARVVLFSGFMEGQFTPDVAMLMSKNVFEAIATIGELAGVSEFKVSLDGKDPEDVEFMSNMGRLKFMNESQNRTKKDFENIKETQEKKPDMGLMSKPTIELEEEQKDV